MVHRRTFLLLGVLPAALLQSIGALLYFVILAETSLAQPVYFFTKLAIVTIIAAWVVARVPLPSPMAGRWRHVVVGTAHGLGLAGVLGLAYLAFGDSLALHSNDIAAKIHDFSLLARYFVPTAIVFSIFHALFEEVYWRWFVVRGLAQSMKPAYAMVLGNLAFTSHHIIVLSQFLSPLLTVLGSLGVFVAGLLWSLLYRKTGSLAASWVSHALADAAIFAAAYALIG